MRCMPRGVEYGGGKGSAHAPYGLASPRRGRRSRDSGWNGAMRIGPRKAACACFIARRRGHNSRGRNKRSK
jgi:hypothetical protein